MIRNFVEQFLNTLAPNKAIQPLSWVKKPSYYYKCIFSIIGYDSKYNRNQQPYIDFGDLAQKYTEIIQKAGTIIHNEQNWSVTTLRKKNNSLYREFVNNTLFILELHKIHYVDHREHPC